MPKKNMTIPSEEQLAINIYDKECKKLSDKFAKIMNNHSLKENIIEGLIGGAIAGALIGFIFSETKATTPTQGNNKQFVEYHFDKSQLTETMLVAISIAVLVGLGMAGIKTASDKIRNACWAEDLTKDTFKRYFKKTLQNYVAEDDKPERYVRAAVFIINNMSERELGFLRIMALDELARDQHGYFNIPQSAIDNVSAMISDYVYKHPEISNNILRIMRGENPTTFFMPGLAKHNFAYYAQKTKQKNR